MAWRLVARAMTDEMTAEGLVKAGVTGTYRVERDTMAAAPILGVTVEDGVASRASAELQVVMKQVPLAAARLQSNSAVPASARISVSEVVRPGTPLRSGKTQMRAVGVALVGGLVLTVFAASFFDAWSVRRRRSRDVAAVPGPAALALGRGDAGEHRCGRRRRVGRHGRGAGGQDRRDRGS
jgi:hypothetical protein